VVARVDRISACFNRGTEKLIEHKDLSAGDPVFRPARLCRADESGARVLSGCGEAARHCRAAARATDPRAVLRDGRILSHLLNVTTQAMDVGALTRRLWGLKEREKLMVFLERASGSACTRLFPDRRRAPGLAAQTDRRYRCLVRKPFPSAWSPISSDC